MNSEKPVILLVEDDENDAFFMQRAMAKTGLEYPVQVVMDGQEALDYLSGSGKFSERAKYPLPHCIFLDLKLPFVHGFEVLKWIREQPALRETIVFILTSSPEERDRERAAELGAKRYLVKPPTPEMLREALQECMASPAGACG